MSTDPSSMAYMLAQGGSPSPSDPSMQALFGVHPQQLQQMAGDVLPLPIAPGQNAGPTNKSSGYWLDEKSAPNVHSIDPSVDAFNTWLNRMRTKDGLSPVWTK